MPNLQNAKKALRVSGRKRIINDKRRRAMKETIKDVRVIVKTDAKKVAETLSKAYQAIDKAAKQGVIKKGAANRKKSRLVAAIKKATTK